MSRGSGEQTSSTGAPGLVSVILPTYNERANIVPLVREVLATLEAAGRSAQVVVVDDDSPDGTAAAVEDAFGGEPRVKLVVRRGERGLATALWRGVCEAGGEVLVFMDSDFNHHPRYLPPLLELLEQGAQVAVGSRYLPGGGMATSRLRWWLSGLFNRMVRLRLGLGTTDNLSGFIAIPRRELLALPVEELFQGYGDWAIRLLWWAHWRGLAVRETAVVYQPRLGGRSKTRFLPTFLSYWREVSRLRRRR